MPCYLAKYKRSKHKKNTMAADAPDISEGLPPPAEEEREMLKSRQPLRLLFTFWANAREGSLSPQRVASQIASYLPYKKARTVLEQRHFESRYRQLTGRTMQTVAVGYEIDAFQEYVVHFDMTEEFLRRWDRDAVPPPWLFAQGLLAAHSNERVYLISDPSNAYFTAEDDGDQSYVLALTSPIRRSWYRFRREFGFQMVREPYIGPTTHRDSLYPEENGETRLFQTISRAQFIAKLEHLLQSPCFESMGFTAAEPVESEQFPFQAQLHDLTDGAYYRTHGETTFAKGVRYYCDLTEALAHFEYEEPDECPRVARLLRYRDLTHDRWISPIKELLFVDTGAMTDEECDTFLDRLLQTTRDLQIAAGGCAEAKELIEQLQGEHERVLRECWNPHQEKGRVRMERSFDVLPPAAKREEEPAVGPPPAKRVRL